MKNTLAKCNEDAYLPSLHLSTVELRCKLQEKLHRVTWPLHLVVTHKVVSILSYDIHVRSSSFYKEYEAGSSTDKLSFYSSSIIGLSVFVYFTGEHSC